MRQGLSNHHRVSRRQTVDAAVTLYVLLIPTVVLPTRMTGATPVILLVVHIRPWVGSAEVSDRAFLPTTEPRAVVAERSEVGVLNTTKVLKRVPTLSEGV